MRCNNCGANLEAGATVCPECNTPVQNGELAQLNKKINGLKIALVAVIAVVLLAVLAVVVVLGVKGGLFDSTEPTGDTGETSAVQGTVPSDGNPDDETCKGTYTAADDAVSANKDTVIATMGEHKLTNGELQVYYWNQVFEFLNEVGSYAVYYGLDYTKPLDQQTFDKETGVTWQQYFLKGALQTWQRQKALEAEAAKNGFQLGDSDKKYLEGMYESLKKTAEEYKFESVDALIQGDFGVGCGYDEYEKYMTTYYISSMFFTQEHDKLVVTDAEVEAYYEKNKDSMKETITKYGEKMIDVRHILLQPKDKTDAALAACLAEAEALLQQWKDGEATEESFGALADEHTADGGSKGVGGLYENVYTGYMVKEFDAWCFDASRKVGDTGIVKTTHGYHIMYFVGSGETWYRLSKNEVLSEKSAELLETMTEPYTMDVDYSLINICTKSFT